ncbi:MAG: hypothetical protein JWM80_1030 [Cyanobacteria bacterium RYN_339]|nr:hypothetical protein [Cyanobacteria bacterium RYN_339]
MHQDPRNNPNLMWFSKRAKATQDDDLKRVGEEFAKLRRFGGNAAGTKAPAPTPPPAPAPAPRIYPVLPAPLSGEKRASELKLPRFIPPPGPAPAPAPEPIQRRVGPAPLRGIKVKNTLQLATALEQARPGDLIVLAEGEYVMPNKRYQLKGTADHPITISGSGALLVGGNNPHTLQLDRCEHLILNGLRFAPRGAQTARAINVTDGNHLTIAGCWIGAGADGKDLAPLHFGSDASGRYNNHNTVLGNVIYARGSAAVHFGPGGGIGARVVDNELRALGPEGPLTALVAFTPGGMSVYRAAVIRGNSLVAEGPAGAGIALAGVAGADVSGNAIRLVRDAIGQAGPMLEIRTDGQVSGLVVHHNEFAYDRPGPDGVGRAAFGFAGPAQATFAHNTCTYLGSHLADGKYAGLVDPAAGLQEAL